MPYAGLILFAALVGPSALAATIPVEGNVDLRVTVEGSVKPGTPLYFALYDDPGAFEQQLDGIHMTVLNHWVNQPSVAFIDLAPGRYVVAVFQDLNGNGKLDTDLLGRPTEPYALSGNAALPRFEAAAINVHTDNKSISLKLR